VVQKLAFIFKIITQLFFLSTVWLESPVLRQRDEMKRGQRGEETLGMEIWLREKEEKGKKTKERPISSYRKQKRILSK